MKLKPEIIEIMGHAVTLIYADLGDKTYAQFKADDRVIELNIRSGVHWTRRHLFHEILHAIIYFSGLKNFLPARLEEALVESLEMNLWPLVRLLV